MPAALRLTFEFENAQMRVLRRRQLNKQTAPSHTWDGAEGESGFWVEVRDTANAVLYRRVMDDPFYRLEGPSNDTGQLRIADVATRKGTFSVVVPVVIGSHTLIVMASRPPEAEATPIFTTTLTGTV